MTHSPPHVFVPNTIYMVTAGTFQKEHMFHSNDRLKILQSALFDACALYSWALQAWAVFSNHYHCVAKSPDEGATLKSLMQPLHSKTAKIINELDNSRDRKVWYQYWDTCITFEASYYARLNYVNHNPVKHGLVADAEQYPFCSAAWFRENEEPDFLEKVQSFPYDRVRIMDDF